MINPKIKEKLKKIKEVFKKGWLWLIIVGVIVLVANILVMIRVPTEQDWNVRLLTFFGGWVSGLATIILGCIALWQNSNYRKIDEQRIKELEAREEYVDLTCTKIEYRRVIGCACNVMTKDFIGDNVKYGFSMSIYGFMDKPIFNIRIKLVEIINNNNSIKKVVPNNIKYECPDQHGRNFLDKNSRMYLGITFDCGRSIDLVLRFVIQYENGRGDVYEKDVKVKGKVLKNGLDITDVQLSELKQYRGKLVNNKESENNG